ncbi:MAG: MarR family transcriptional regulator [Clostridia bacterium]|nr:MarR family transcriptional regulator [Clostridia bacterium]
MPAIMRRMNAISRAQGVYRAAALGDGELNGCHHSFVLAICHTPGMSQEQLARHLCFNKSTVTRALAYLEERGYVTRTPSEADKRITLVYPTEKMQAVLPRVKAVAAEWQNALVADESPEEIEAFSAMLSRMEARAKALVEGVKE